MIDSRPPFGFSPKITAGLEPASGGYERPRILRALRSLNRNDAEFVDVIHTNANVIGLGTTSPIGHADFYPNGGQWQTGCFRTTEYDSFSKNFIHLVVSNLTGLCTFLSSLQPWTSDSFLCGIHQQISALPIGAVFVDWTLLHGLLRRLQNGSGSLHLHGRVHIHQRIRILLPVH